MDCGREHTLRRTSRLRASAGATATGASVECVVREYSSDSQLFLVDVLTQIVDMGDEIKTLDILWVCVG